MTFEQLKTELDQNKCLTNIRNVDGVYKVYFPKDFEVKIRPDTDAIREFRNKSMLYSTEKLEEKLSRIRNVECDDNHLLYIGKASRTTGRGLRKRIEELVRYGYLECQNHRGGRAIWQLENNKKLILEYVECENPTEMEKEELMKYKDKHGIYPFANWRL